MGVNVKFIISLKSSVNTQPVMNSLGMCHQIKSLTSYFSPRSKLSQGKQTEYALYTHTYIHHIYMVIMNLYLGLFTYTRVHKFN